MFRSKRSKAAKCKTQLRMIVSRIKLLRNKRETQLKHLRRDIAQLLENKQDENARSRVDHAVREQNMIEAYGIIEGCCEFLTARLSSITSQKTCPPELLESVSNLIYAAPRCADLPELLEIRSIFGDKYGKHFLVCIVELREGCGVSKQLIEKLSTHPLPTEKKMDYMTHVARDFNLKWQPIDLAADEAKSKPALKPTRDPVQLDTRKAPDNDSPKSPLQVEPTPAASAIAESSKESSEDEQLPRRTTPPGGKQFVPFARNGPANTNEQVQISEEGKPDPYLQFRNQLNPYERSSGQGAPADPYAEYKKKLMPSSFSDVASAAEAAAESADHAAAAARVAAQLANKELSRASSSSSMSKEHPTRRVSVANLEERVASYLKSQVNDDESSEWESPAAKEPVVQELNPSRNLWSESQPDDSLSKRHSTGDIEKQSRKSLSKKPSDEKRQSTGMLKSEVLFRHGFSDPVWNNGKSQVNRGAESNSDLHDDLFRAESSKADKDAFQHSSEPLYDEGDRKEPVLWEPETESSDEDHHNEGPRFDEHLPSFGNGSPYSRQDSVARGLQTMHERISSKFEELYEEDEDESPRASSRQNLAASRQQQPGDDEEGDRHRWSGYGNKEKRDHGSEVTRSTWKPRERSNFIKEQNLSDKQRSKEDLRWEGSRWQPAEVVKEEESDEEPQASTWRVSHTTVTKFPNASSSNSHFDFQIHRARVDHEETSPTTGARRHKAAAASVRTRRS